MTINSESYGKGSARIIRRETQDDILALPVTEIKDLFKSAGVLLFRGFGVDPWLMKSFAEQFSSRFNRDQSRPPVEGSHGFVQKVTEGMSYVEPHSEQANSPFRPDAIWFCCTTPAEAGGETLFWDGIKLWEALSEELKELFRSKKLRFFQRYAAERWRLFLGEGATVADAERELEGVEGVSYYVSADESIYLEYLCSAVVQTKYGNHSAFANSLLLEQRTLKSGYGPTGKALSESGGDLGDLVSFEDSTPIPNAVIEEIRSAYKGLTEEITWQPGDLVFIDNSRYLHGRNSFNDPRRELHSCVSFLNF